MPMHSRALLLALSTASIAVACVDPPVHGIEGEYPPKGVMRGTVTYSGPLPCGAGGHILGNANILVFNVNLLPPPEGLGVTAHRIAAVPGDVLFADVASQVPADGCPPPDAAPVTVTATFEVGPIDPGMYQVRGFFDYDGDFSPVFNFANLPTKGDIGGGAIANIADVIKDPAANPPRFQEIPVGVQQPDGTWTIPDTGFVASNVGVTLSDAGRIGTQRPYFHIAQYLAGAGEDGTQPAPVDAPLEIKIPADFHMYDAGLVGVEKSIFKFTLASGLPAAEDAAAKNAPFYFHTGDQLMLSAYDANHDGDLTNDKTIADKKLAAFAPVITLAKLDMEHDPDQIMRTTQTLPFVLSAAITARAGLLTALAGPKPGQPEFQDQITAFLPPTVVCAENPADPKSRTVIVTPFQTDTKGNNIVSSEAESIHQASLQLQRDEAGISFAYRCLPPGRYALNVIYPATTQAWTLPNESGVCMPGEAPGQSEGMPICGSRERLSSQAVYIEITAASNPDACNAMKSGDSKSDPYAAACLTPSERARFDSGDLWR